MEGQSTWWVSLMTGFAKLICRQCALERKIPMLKTSWVTENYQVWLRGDDVDTVKVSRPYTISMVV